MNPHLVALINECERMPFLEAYAVDGETVCLVLSGRLGLELSEADACAIIPFIVDCIKAAQGRFPQRRRAADSSRQIGHNVRTAGNRDG